MEEGRQIYKEFEQSSDNFKYNIMGGQHSDNSQGYIQDSRFGLIKLEGNIRHTQSQDVDSEELNQVIVLKRHQLSNSEYEKWKKKLRGYSDLGQILFLPASTKIIKKGFCGSNCNLQLKYPVYRILLRQQVVNRYRINKYYEQTEIWYLLYNLVALGKHFEKYGHKIGDVHPKNIVINDKGWVKIIGQVSLPNEQDNFFKICQSQINDVFLAPQQIDYDCFQRYKYPPGVNPNTSELFSMGMTLLQVGTLQPSTYIYDKGPYRINFNKLKANLQVFKSKYSRKLYEIIQTLVALKPSNRRSCKSLYNSLKQFQNSILSLEPFVWEDSLRPKHDSLKYSSVGTSQDNSSLLIPNLIDNKRNSSNSNGDQNAELPIQTRQNFHPKFIKTQSAEMYKRPDYVVPTNEFRR